MSFRLQNVDEDAARRPGKIRKRRVQRAEAAATHGSNFLEHHTAEGSNLVAKADCNEFGRQKLRA